MNNFPTPFFILDIINEIRIENKINKAEEAEFEIIKNKNMDNIKEEDFIKFLGDSTKNDLSRILSEIFLEYKKDQHDEYFADGVYRILEKNIIEEKQNKNTADLLQVGSTLELKVSCLRNDIGSKGLCYEVYTLLGRKGFSFIFPNGLYDGFSEREVESFFDTNSIAFVPEVSNYKFTNVMKLNADFYLGVFKKVWE